MMEKVSKFASGQVASGEGVTQAEYLMLSQQGNVLWQQGRAAEAERLFRGLLERLEAGAAYDAAYDRAMTLMSLGRCLAAQGRPAQAIAYHRRALGEFERIANERESESARKMLGRVYPDLGDNLAAVGQFDEAQRAYESGLEIQREVDDHRSIGVSLGQLGTLAEMRGDLAEAARRHTEALETFRALGEPQMEAVAWHQLGKVANKAREWDEAERCFRESLKLEESYNNLPGIGQTSNALAVVAENAGRLNDAERWYLRAIEVDEQLGYQNELATACTNLAGLYLSRGRLDEAARYARRAVEIKEKLDLSAEPWTTYSILAQIAEAQGRPAEAAEWRRKEQENYAAYAGASLDVQKWEQEIAVIVAACQGNSQAQEVAEQIIAHYQDNQDWGNLVAAFRRILDGERDTGALGTDLDRIDYAIIHTILAQLSGSAPSAAAGEASPQTWEVSETSQVPPPPEQEGITLNQLLALVATACTAAAPPGLGEQLYGATRAMATDPNAPPEIRALGSVLNRVLSGERDPDLSALPPQLAQAVQGMLEKIRP